MSSEELEGSRVGQATGRRRSQRGDSSSRTRRDVLRATGGAAGVFAVGSARAHGDGETTESDYCAESSLRPGMVHYDEAGIAACADDHPTTRKLQKAVATALETTFPTVGSLIDDGYVPYFDFAIAEEGSGLSHWLNPEYLGDDSVLDPERPESILVDHQWWRPVGVMFVATADGDPVHPPPVVYPRKRGGAGTDDGTEDETGQACLPWHAHTGLPGRKAWWKYRKLYVDAWEALESGFPCRTPWMMHVWAFPHPEGVYAHGALPRGNRGGPPAEPAGFETDAVPGEDRLDEKVLLEAAGERFEDRLEQLL